MSSEAVLTPSRVLRGAAAAGLRGAALGADLTLLAPPPPTPDAVTPVYKDDVEEAKAARDEAARVGYQDGFAAGRQDALLAAEAQAAAAAEATAAALQAMHAAAAELHARQSADVAEAERQIVDLAMAIAEAVVQRELSTASTSGRDALLRALALAPQGLDAVARLHPADLDTVGDLTQLTAERDIVLVADPTVEQGGCLLDVGPCRIDAQITPALARVKKALGA